MIYTIKKGKHYARPFRIGLFWGKKNFRWKCVLMPSCTYDHHGADQLDINKLVGIGYLPGHHTDSARFGWRYVQDIHRFEIFAYCYVSGKRVMKPICTVGVGEVFICELVLVDNCRYTMRVHISNGYYSEIIRYNHKKKFAYRLDFYFGGNLPAQKNAQAQITRVK